MKIKAVHAQAIYDILVAVCHAPETDRQRFVKTLGKDNFHADCEWRLMGGYLGMGGKFFWDSFRWRVSCDQTPERQLLVSKANTMLARLQQPWYMTLLHRFCHVSVVKSFGKAKLTIDKAST